MSSVTGSGSSTVMPATALVARSSLPAKRRYTDGRVVPAVLAVTWRVTDQGEVVESAFGLSIPRTLDEACDPRRMALLVYDMQVGVLGQIRGAQEIIDNVIRVIDAARAGGFRTIYLRHMSVPKEVAGVAQLRTAMAWQRVDHVAEVTPVFLRDSAEFALVPELIPRPTEIIFDKIGRNEAAAQRTLESLAFAGGSLQTDVATVCPALLAGGRHTADR